MRRTRVPGRVMRAALLLLVVAAYVRRLPGQQEPTQPVLGIVRDSAGQQPLPGAVVLLLNSLGQTVGRSTTDQRGQFRVPTPSDARRIRILRLGFRPQERAVPAGGAGMHAEVSLVSIPFLLEQVRVTAGASCPRRPDRAAALALLDQVRAGLLGTVVARAQNRARTTRLLFERRLDGVSDRVVSQSVRVKIATGADRPFGAALSGLAFVRQGFLEDSTNTFFGPDAE